jgi:hypothetical protein
VQVGQVRAAERDVDVAVMTGLQGDPAADQPFGGLAGGGRQSGVGLGDLAAGPVAGVGQPESDAYLLSWLNS